MRRDDLVGHDGCSQSGRWLCRDVGTLYAGIGELVIFASFFPCRLMLFSADSLYVLRCVPFETAWVSLSLCLVLAGC